MTITAGLLAKALMATAAVLNGGDAPAAAADKPATKPATKPAAAKGPTLEEVQDKIRALVAADEGNAAKVKAEITKLGGKRAGDFENDAAKLAKLMTALEGVEGSGASDDSDDDLL